MTRVEISNCDHWRVSMSGFSIKTGCGDEKRIIAKYPYKASPVDTEKYQQWLNDAEKICEDHNGKQHLVEQACAVAEMEKCGANEDDNPSDRARDKGIDDVIAALRDKFQEVQSDE